jgi:hypothetical protein
MNKKERDAFAKQAAKSIKTESGLTDFRKILTKDTVKAALNAELPQQRFLFNLTVAIIITIKLEKKTKNRIINGFCS